VTHAAQLHQGSRLACLVGPPHLPGEPTSLAGPRAPFFELLGWRMLGGMLRKVSHVQGCKGSTIRYTADLRREQTHPEGEIPESSRNRSSRTDAKQLRCNGPAGVQGRGARRRTHRLRRCGRAEIYGFSGPNAPASDHGPHAHHLSSGSARVADMTSSEQGADVRGFDRAALQEAALDRNLTARAHALQGALHGSRRPTARRRGNELIERVASLRADRRRSVATRGAMVSAARLASRSCTPALLFSTSPPPAWTSSSSRLWDRCSTLSRPRHDRVLTTSVPSRRRPARRTTCGIIDDGQDRRRGGTPGRP